MRFICTLFLFLGVMVGFSVAPVHAQTTWVTFEKLDSLERLEKRPVLVFVTAPWCVYCKAMKRTTFMNKKVAAELNSHFYALELDTEKEQTIDFNGKNYRYKSNGKKAGLQELAIELALVNGQMSYPTLVFLKPGQAGKLVYPAYATAKELMKMLEGVKSWKENPVR